jgi:hypothetical protein
MPPHAYQIQARLLRARELLRNGRAIAEVAAMTGFADQSHFHRHFKRLLGTTPAQFTAERSRRQGGQSGEVALAKNVWPLDRPVCGGRCGSWGDDHRVTRP